MNTEIDTLSPKASELLDKLVSDFKSKLPVGERVLEDNDYPSLIYNLFNGDYDFSYKIYKELFNYLINRGK